MPRVCLSLVPICCMMLGKHALTVSPSPCIPIPQLCPNFPLSPSYPHPHHPAAQPARTVLLQSIRRHRRPLPPSCWPLGVPPRPLQACRQGALPPAKDTRGGSCLRLRRQQQQFSQKKTPAIRALCHLQTRTWGCCWLAEIELSKLQPQEEAPFGSKEAACTDWQAAVRHRACCGTTDSWSRTWVAASCRGVHRDWCRAAVRPTVPTPSTLQASRGSRAGSRHNQGRSCCLNGPGAEQSKH